MASWVLTKNMADLLEQINAAFPARDHTSDGTIGDTAHQAETSGHNPDRTGNAEYKDGDALNEVRAIDIDSDLRAAPATAQQVVDHIRELPGASSVLRYMIYNRKIYRASNGWKAEAYTGASAHTEHIHFSGQFTQAADNNTSFDYRLEEIPVALTDADKTWMQNTIGAQISTARAAIIAEVNQVATEAAQAVWATQFQRPGEPAGSLTSAGAYQSYNDIVNRDTANAAAATVVSTLGAKLDQLLAKP